MPRVIVVGGGWSGCAAAVAVAKLGVEVVLLERTDMLLGTGLVGGLFRNNGRYTGAEEAIAMGAGEMIGVMDRAAIHTGVEFPKHHHGSLYDCRKVEGLARQVLADFGVQTVLESRVVGVHRSGDRLTAVRLESGDAVEGKVFVDATGTAGSQANCARYGNGCVMCALRCPTFGKRVSVAAQAGVREMIAERPGGLKGAMSGSAAVAKDTVAREIVAELQRTGSLVIPLPAVLQDRGSMQGKVCQQYSGEEFAANLVLIDNGNVKFIHPYFPLERLHRLDGFEAARYVDPYSGGTGNSIRFLGMAPRDDTLKVEGPANLYCGGEKAGIFV
ncbi:MAG: FAD-dependent oxidoreductase, partial [Firmicutes bacterium]|nr:FAD-dependent oxidoreductase [Bacillota bacterium]